MRLFISPVNHHKLKKDLLSVGVFTFVTVLIWISYSIYLAYSQPTIDEEVASLLEPLNPTLDQETLSQVGNRYQPPEDFTILVKRQAGDSSVIVPIDQAFDAPESSPSAQAEQFNPPASTTSAQFEDDTTFFIE